MTSLPFWAPLGLLGSPPWMILTRQAISLIYFRPTRVAFHEVAAIAHDLRAAKNWRERVGYLFRGPGWSPDGSGGGTRG